MIWLFTSFYPESDPHREAEIRRCLDINLAQKSIDRVGLLLERTVAPLQHPKLWERPVGNRPQYCDFFHWANAICSEGDLAIVCNSDIFFDSDVRMFENVVNESTCVALTRWNISSDGTPRLFDRNDTQDTWLFRVPIRDFKSDYPIGVPRCDNRMLHELQHAGYEVLNPALSLRSYHLHAGDREDYIQENLSSFVSPPYAYMWPHNCKSLPETIIHNLFHPSDRLRWRFDWRRMRQAFPIRAINKLRTYFAASGGA